MDERTWLYRLKRTIEDRIDGLDAPPAPPPTPTAPRRVAIVVGHSARSPGAYAKPPISTNEYFWNSDLADQMVGVAERRDGLALTVFYRDNGGVRGAYRAASAWGAGAVIELHFNAAASTAANGTEVVFDAPHDELLARLCQQHMVGALGLRDRGIKPPWNGRGAANDDAAQHIPSVIVEPFFAPTPMIVDELRRRSRRWRPHSLLRATLS